MKDKKLFWNLDDVVSLDGFKTLLSEAEGDLLRFDDFYKGMSPDMSACDFGDFMGFYERLNEEYHKLCYLPELMKSADQKSETALLLKNKVENFTVKLGDAARRFDHWVMGKDVQGARRLDDENAKRLFACRLDLNYYFSRERNSARYTLSEAEEKIVTRKDLTGTSVLTDLRTLIETEFTYFFKPEGAKRGKTIKTQSGILRHVHSAEPAKRKAAYVSLLSKYRDCLDKFFLVYQAVVKDWGHMAELRGHPSPISMRNHANGVSDSAVQTLLNVCSDNRGVFQDYFRFKAKELGMEKLRRFDVYAPLKKAEMEEISFPDALDLVLGTLDGFSLSFGKRARMIVDAEHIDSHPSDVKEGGGFCATVCPGIAPYVSLNFNGTKSYVPTIAHELGHGVHALYADKLSVLTQHATLPLCETASMLAELVLFEKLYNEEEGGEVKKAMLSERVADSFKTVLRQNYFVNFEIEAHEKIREGVSAEQLSDIYLGTLAEQFGDSVDIDPLFRNEWAYIPHIVEWPFYCYAYNFGELVSLSLFSEYKNKGESFIPKMEKILAAGGSRDPADVLKEVGFDIESKGFWQKGFDIIKAWQKDLENF